VYVGVRNRAPRRGARICPRCGEPISYVERHRRGERIYYYAVHEYYANGKRVARRKCYLGPEVYVHGELFNRLGLAGLVDPKRYVRYLITLLARIDAMNLASEEKEALAEELKKALERLEGRGKTPSD
jgi:hypothetical protein